MICDMFNWEFTCATDWTAVQVSKYSKNLSFRVTGLLGGLSEMMFITQFARVEEHTGFPLDVLFLGRIYLIIFILNLKKYLLVCFSKCLYLFR